MNWQYSTEHSSSTTSTLYDVSASEYNDKHKDQDISFTIRTLLFHFNEHDVAHESRIVVVCSSSGFSYLFFFVLAKKLALVVVIFFSFFILVFMIGVVSMCVCFMQLCVGWFVCIFFSFFKAIFARSKLETLCCIPLQPCGELKKHIQHHHKQICKYCFVKKN